MVPCEYGTDIGGSVRVPAHFCGVWGHKTSWGLVSKHGHDHPAMAGGDAHDGALSIAGPLARNAADVSALLDAGEAALDVGDIDAAIGFFGRAKQLLPTNSRISLGLGKAYARSRRPIEALRLFAEAERAGVANDRMAEDRGMAFMLVGDNRSAQDLFRLALA